MLDSTLASVIEEAERGVMAVPPSAEGVGRTRK